MDALRDVRVDSALTIRVAGGTGCAPTSLAAFDDALGVVGLQNFNLIRLSSVIPPRTRVIVADPVDGGASVRGTDAVDLRAPAPSTAPAVTGTWGDRLYAVWAAAWAHQLGEEAWAGVAWVQDPDDLRGLFVEHEGASEAQVCEELAATLTHISSSRGMGHLSQQSVVVGARCEGPPVAALVIAPYLTEPWGDAPRRSA